MGLLDEDRWRIHRSNLQALLGRQGVRLWWATRSHLIESPEFAVLVSELLGNKPEPEGGDHRIRGASGVAMNQNGALISLRRGQRSVAVLVDGAMRLVSARDFLGFAPVGLQSVHD